MHPPGSELLVSIPSSETVRGNLYIPNVDKVNGPVDIVFTSLSGRPIIVSLTRMDWSNRKSITSEELFRRERLATLNQQVVVTGRVIGGGMWIGDGAGAELLESTSLAGFAVRIQRGYRSGFAIEDEIAGARTGTAQFDDLNWQGTQGDVIRSATLGRVLGGVAMRFGHDVVLTGRAGIGFHGTNIRSEFLTVGGDSLPGPGGGFAFDMLLYGGLGVDVRFGNQWSLGAAVDGGREWGGVRFVHAGLQFGYGWN